MIFLGDIAHPFTHSPDWSALKDVIGGQPSVVNLEGSLTKTDHQLSGNALFNHISVITSLHSINTVVASLANNHICDFPGGATKTVRELTEQNILPVGAGASMQEAEQPVRLEHEGKTYLFVAAGWKTIGCIPAGKNKPGTNPLRPKNLLALIRRLRRGNPDAIIIPLLHWNYEMEPHPQPAHRILAFAAIDAGADLLIGHHPHCVGGFELYRGKLIAYSLGNWWLPQSVFFDGRLKYAEYSYKQVALEWSPDNPAKIHWFQYHPENHNIQFNKTEEFSCANPEKDIAPYSCLSKRGYEKWFTENRKKRKALPIYRDIDQEIVNHTYDLYVKIRHKIVLILKRFL